MSLRATVAIITGASRGLGKAVALRLVREGTHVAIAGRDAAALNAVAEELRVGRIEHGQQIAAQVTDVSVPNDVDRLIEVAGAINGRIDVLVSNAGVYGPMGRVEEVNWADWADALQINLLGTVLCCRAVVPWMRRQGKGKIILISGGGATQPLPRLSAYAASKAAVVRFGETLAAELRESGIDVNAVAPGALNTRLLDQVIAAGPGQVGPAFHARALQQRETGGTPLETPAELIAFLASSASDGITGRLLSAVWDKWQDLPARLPKLQASDVYTLRRIVPADRGWDPE